MQDNGWTAVFFSVEAGRHDQHEVLKYLLGTGKVDVWYKDKVIKGSQIPATLLLTVEQRGNTAMDIARIFNPAALEFFPETSLVVSHCSQSILDQRKYMSALLSQDTSHEPLHYRAMLKAYKDMLSRMERRASSPCPPQVLKTEVAA
jgi:hypothetical protein